MKKLYIILAFVVVSILMVFAGDTIKVLRIYHNGTFISIPLTNIDSIDHSKLDVDGKLQANYTSTVIETLDSTYNIPISEIDSVVIGETQIGDALLYEKVSGELYSYISSHEGATIEDIQEQLKKYPSSVTSEVKSNILYVYIDGYEYICDPYNITCPIQSDDDYNFVDNDLNILIREIDEALYPKDYNGARLKSRMDHQYIPKKIIRALSESMLELTEGYFFAWDPWNQITFKKIEAPNPMANSGSNATLSVLKEFSKFNVGLIICHGSEDGCLAIPANDSYLKELKDKGMKPYIKKVDKEGNVSESGDYVNGTTGTGNESQKAYILKESALSAFLPDDLSKTILWTAMCFSDVSGSILKKVVEERHVAAYAGANNMVYLNGIIQEWCKGFVRLFYDEKNPMSAGKAAMEIFKAEQAKSPVTINIKNSPADYTYSFYYYDKTIMYKPYVVAMNSVNNQPRASITLPYELVGNASAVRTRASSNPNLSAGFWLKNKNTGKETELEIEKSTVTIHKRYDYKELISRVELLGNTTDLEPGTYEYRTYLEIDGKKTYSEEIYEFMKQSSFCPDNNHPHWIDLGLPSGTHWRCCNEGAFTPEAYGGYHEFGQVASAPSLNQIKELLDHTTSEWTTRNGVGGRRFTGSNGRTIFLPAAGILWDGEFYDVGYSGYYWSSTPEDEYDAFGLGFLPDNAFWRTYGRDNDDELSVRPVR